MFAMVKTVWFFVAKNILEIFVLIQDCDLDESTLKNKQKLIELTSKLDVFMNDLFEYINLRSKDEQGSLPNF